MMDEKAKELYDRLNKSGFKLPDYDVFHSGLQDRETANKLHGKLRGAGYKLPDFDDFYSTFATEEPVIEEPVVDENQAVPTGSTLSTNPILMALSQRPTKEPTESEKELNPVMSYLNIFSS